MFDIEETHPLKKHLSEIWSEPNVKNVFGRLEAPKVLDRAYLLTDAMAQGKFLSLCQGDAIDKLHLTVEQITPYLTPPKLFVTIKEAVLLQADSGTTKVMKIDEFLLNQFGYSKFLYFLKRIIETEEWDRLISKLSASDKPLIDAISTSIHRRFTGWIYFIQWYEKNSERISNTNRGAFSLSPLRTLHDAISDYLTFILSNKLESCFIDSPNWYKYLDYLTNEFSIDTTLTDVVDVRYTTNYKHEDVILPPSLYERINNKQ